MRAAVIVLVLLLWPAAASAQVSGALLKARWDAAVASLENPRAITAMSESDKRALYREVLRRLVVDPQLDALFHPPQATIERLISERTPDVELAQIQALVKAGAGSKAAKAMNASATNPTAPAAAERSGATDLVALAFDTKGILNADKSAVTINLNALAFLGLGSPVLSAPAVYRQHDALRRLSGTFTFGAKIPEREITGFSGLPSANDLLDVFVWDVKYRVIGDRDARARRWDRLMVGMLGGLTELVASVPAFVPAADRALVAAEAREFTSLAAGAVRDELGRSWQVSVKAAGQHLSNEAGKDKYSVTVLGDKGFGQNGDLTFNLTYAKVDDVKIVPGVPVSLKAWSAALGFNRVVARDVLVVGRGTELSLNARFEKPHNDPIAVVRKRLWHVVGAVTLPIGDAANIPLSITFTSDPNRLQKEKFVTGYVGISYDFGALNTLFRPKQNPGR